MPIGVDEISEQCNSFVLVLKPSGEVRPYLNPARLNQALIRPVHRGIANNNILLKIKHTHIILHMDASSGYHSIKLNEKSPYLTKFVY